MRSSPSPAYVGPLHTVAVQHCRRLTERSGSSFAAAFMFLPRAEREALDAVYAFCRLVDDAADDAPTPEDARERLAEWREELDAVYGDAPPHQPITAALRRAVRRFPIRREDMEAVIEGCEWDQHKTRYATWAELEAYCYRVASVVGLMCIEIFGYTSPRARDYARDLGIALQLTNILRDVAEDARRGRLYLPAEDLALVGAREEDLFAGRRTPAVAQLLRLEAGRAREHYQRARAALDPDERDRLVVAEIMGDIYYALLVELERRDFPLDERVTIPATRKATIALRRFALARLRRFRPT